jgi:hypothetical protein
MKQSFIARENVCCLIRRMPRGHPGIAVGPCRAGDHPELLGTWCFERPRGNGRELPCRHARGRLRDHRAKLAPWNTSARRGIFPRLALPLPQAAVDGPSRVQGHRLKGEGGNALAGICAGRFATAIATQLSSTG